MLIATALATCTVLNVFGSVDCEGEISGKPDIVNIQGSFGEDWTLIQNYTPPEDCQCTSGELVINDVDPDQKYMVIISGETGYAKYLLNGHSEQLKTTWNTNGLSDRCKMENISVYSSTSIGTSEPIPIPPAPSEVSGGVGAWPLLGLLGVPFLFGGSSGDSGDNGNTPVTDSITPPSAQEVPEPTNIGGLVIGAVLVGKLISMRKNNEN